MRKKLLLPGLTIFLTALTLHGQTLLTLTSKDKKYKIKAGDECYIKTVPSTNDTAKNYYNIHIGYIVRVKDSILELNSVGINTIYQTNNGIKRLYAVGLNNVPVNLNIKQIEEIENYRNWFMAPALVGWIALISTVVISPLVSTNFKTPSFDSNKFYKVGGISLGTTVASMTIAYGFGRHSLYINNGQQNHKRLWKILE
jgi:hypothetical protein